MLQKRDLEEFAAALSRSKQGNLLDLAERVREAGVEEEAREILRRTAAGENGAAVLDEVVRRSVKTSPALRRAIENIRPKRGSGIESVTLSTGGESVTLRPR